MKFEETGNLGELPRTGRESVGTKTVEVIATAMVLKEPLVPSFLQQVVEQCHASWRFRGRHEEIRTLSDLKAGIINHGVEVSRKLLRATIETALILFLHVIDVNGAHNENIERVREISCPDRRMAINAIAFELEISHYRIHNVIHADLRKKVKNKFNIHWCAKIKDEVEKLAYQLNEEAERTERPIRRLSKVMISISGKEIAHRIAVKITPSFCLSEKWRVINLLDDIWMLLTRGRLIGKLEEGSSVTKVAAEFGIAHSIVSRLWRQFQTTGIAIRGSVVVVHEEPHPQMTGTLFYRAEETGGRQREKSLDTRHSRLDDRYIAFYLGQKTARWWSVCTTPYESRFSLSSDSHRILIWRERGSRNHPSNIIERDRYGGRGVLVWGGIMLGSRTDLHIFDAGSVNGTRYCNEILLPYVRLLEAHGSAVPFMDDNAPCHRTVAAEQLLESEDVERMDLPARSPDLNPIAHVWDFLGRRLAARTLPPVTIRELRLALQDEWAAMP
ncbi:transposable element Tc3 transposase [Trichonephila clavipes]|nr:transposable element Tc3 transposase [Trichonephila clavipes]